MKGYVNYILLIVMAISSVECAQRRNTSGRLGRGSNSRSNSYYNGVAFNQSSGQAAPNSQGDVMAFFSNFANANGTPYQVPCGANQITMSANVQATIDQYGGGYTDIPSSGANLHLTFGLGCAASDGATSIRVDIA